MKKNKNKNSYCGTTLLMEDKISESLLLRYGIVNNKLVLLTPEFIKENEGKDIEVYSPLFCKSKEICARCLGQQFYQYEIGEDIGLTSMRVTASIMTSALKKMHDSSISIQRPKLFNYFYL